MQVEKLAIDAEKAAEYYRAYKEHQHYESAIDREIRTAYRALSKGKLVIQALESIKAAGVNDEGLPKLAIAGATAKTVYLSRWQSGAADMAWHERAWRFKSGRMSTRWPRESFHFPAETFPMWDHKTGRRSPTTSHQAQVPLIPINLRPKQALEEYHILFEAEWRRCPPIDPYLIRRIGKSDMWIVCAMWDLTPVERAALATRVSVQ
jgi:hypothetical protein